MNSPNAKSLVAYFSREGKNIISSGDVIDLSVGNTEVMAQMIQKAMGSDCFRIETVNPYPEDYNQTTDVAKKELRANARPKLTAHVENMGAYDVIFVGYPNWWGTMPMPVFTFLEEYDFTERTVAPFARTREAAWDEVLRISKNCAHIRRFLMVLQSEAAMYKERTTRYPSG